MNLPVVDLSPFLREEGVVIGKDPTPEQLNVASQINHANCEYGFLCLKNFGIEREFVEKCFSGAKDLFDLPEAIKREKLKPVDENEVGYVNPSMNEVKQKEGSLYATKEAFKIRNKAATDFSYCPPSFEKSSLELYERIQNVKRRYSMATALALGVDPKMLVDMHEDLSLNVIRFNHYPPFKTQKDTTAVRLGAHTDFGTHTFLFLNGDGNGLEIQPRSMEHTFGWMPVKVPKDVYCVVNLGNMMQVLSNGLWKATRHRVMLTNQDHSEHHRYSIACFSNPGKDVTIQPLKEVLKNGKSPKYKPFNAGDYFQGLVHQIHIGTYEMETKEDD